MVVPKNGGSLSFRIWYIDTNEEWFYGRIQECVHRLKTTYIRTDVQIIAGDTSMKSCARGALRRRLLSTKSKAYRCCLQLWLTIVCVVLEYCPLDQHMHYGHVISACSSTFIH